MAKSVRTNSEFWVWLSVIISVGGGGSTLKSDVFLKLVRRVERFMTGRWSCWRVWWLNRKCQPCSTVSSWYSSTACRSAATYSNRYNVSWSTSFCCRYFLLSAEEHVCCATLCKAPYRIICYLFLSVCLFVCPSVCLSVCTYLSVTVVTRIEMVKYVIKLFTTFLLRMKKALRWDANTARWL